MSLAGRIAACRARAAHGLDTGDPREEYLIGGVIAAAAAYQLTPLKQACLVKCRSPMMFLAERWRHGRAGGLELGPRHGAWCLGCCWALMAALFAVGVMSLGWMAVIAAFIGGEKLVPDLRRRGGPWPCCCSRSGSAWFWSPVRCRASPLRTEGRTTAGGCTAPVWR